MTEQDRSFCGKRRTHYGVRIYHPDYFIVSRLKIFVENAIEAHVQPGMKLLDIGCGEQPFRNLITKSGAEYVGLDRMQNASHSVDFLAEADKIPFENAFDVILCTELLEHMAEPQRVMEQMRKSLKPDGLAIITTPFVYPLHEQPHDYVRCTPYCIHLMAAKCSLQIVEENHLGNEIELIAAIWSHLWFNLKIRYPIFPIKLASNLLIAISNLSAMFLSTLFRPFLPKRLFHSIAVVIKKKSTAPSP